MEKTIQMKNKYKRIYEKIKLKIYVRVLKIKGGRQVTT